MVKVSVVLATKNGAQYLEAAIDSIMQQTLRDFELILVDDHSTDATPKIIQRYAAHDKRIVSIKNNQPAGFTRALNVGLRIAKGEYIARMDDDDLSHPDRLKREAEYLDCHPEVALVGSNINYFDESGVYGHSHLNERPDRKAVWKHNPFVHPTIMFRHSCLNIAGYYNESDSALRIEDYDFWCRLYSRDLVGVNLKECLLDYRENQGSFKRRKSMVRVRLVVCMHKWRKRLSLSTALIVFEGVELAKLMVPMSFVKHYHKYIFTRG